MAKVAKKVVAKKGKYFQIISWAPHLLIKTPVGDGRLEVWLPPYGIGMLVWHTSLSWHQVEVRDRFSKLVKLLLRKKSGQSSDVENLRAQI
jgi:hypothetical protein